MINCQKALAKATGKSEKRFGLSVVVDLNKNRHIYRCSQDIKNLISNSVIKRFNWIEEQSYHLTILRCKSVYSDFDATDETIEFLRTAFNKKNEFTVSALSAKLDDDGIIRLYFTEMPLYFFCDIDISTLSIITGLKYTTINKPWVTVAYAIPEFIISIKEDYSYINKRLQEVEMNFHLDVNSVTIVKYYDNAFQTKHAVSNIMLGGTL